MKNKTLRILSLAAVPLAASASSMPAFAYNLDENGNSIEMEEYQNSEESTYTNSANVFAEQKDPLHRVLERRIFLTFLNL